MDSYVLTDEARTRGAAANLRWRDRHQPERRRNNVAPVVEPSDLDVAYTAGFLDGEGYVGALRKGAYISTRLAVSQVDPRPLDWLRDRWGGSVGLHGAYQPNRRDAGNWTLSNKDLVAALLRRVLPLLLVKEKQARLVLELAELPKLVRGQPNVELIEHRMALYDELRGLNRRGRRED